MIQKKRTGLVVAGLLACLVAGAQTLHVKGTHDGGDVEALELSIKPVGGVGNPAGVKMIVSGNKFECDAEPSETGFYMLYGRLGQEVQLMTPVYTPHADGTLPLKTYIDGKQLCVKSGNDNKALTAFSRLVGEKDMYFWTQQQQIGKEALLPFLKSYLSAADSIAAKYKCSEPVRQYMNLWGYSAMSGNYSAIPHALGIKKSELPFGEDELFANSHKMLDTPLASCFPAVFQMILAELPKGGMTESLEALFADYSSDVIRKRVADLVAERFVTRFNYSGDCEKGMAELNNAIAKYGVDARYADEFTKRYSSVKGASFPDVELVDADGNRMDFSSFKGYYVYVDLWASWCGPCCREVPFLKELEKELQNKNVKFLSISLDKNQKAWKDKMKALDMHGNQWIDPNDQLAKALNVQGIPRFLIYDKNGNLYNGNAPRPSNPETLHILENLK